MSWTRRLQAEDGMTLVELLIAMVVMSIGITAIVAGYSSGILAVDRAKADATAGALADRQMEAYRQASFAAVPTPAAAQRRRRTGSTGGTYWIGTTISWTCVVGSRTTRPTNARAAACRARRRAARSSS